MHGVTEGDELTGASLRDDRRGERSCEGCRTGDVARCGMERRGMWVSHRTSGWVTAATRGCVPVGGVVVLGCGWGWHGVEAEMEREMR